MEVLKTYQDIAGKYYYKVLLTDGNIMDWKFTVTPTTQELLDLETKYIDLLLYDSVEQELIDVLEQEDIIREFVKLIKENPTGTFVQYESWLGNQVWYEKDVVRFFMYSLANKVAQRKGVSVSGYTEEQVFLYLRDRLVEKTAREIEKMIFNN